jgi:hypothetical protein
MIASAPKIPLLGALITSGVGLTGLFLALLGYESTLAIIGGAAVASVAWIALYWREGNLGEQDGDEPQIVDAWHR